MNDRPGLFRKYRDVKFKQETLDLVVQIGQITEDYEGRGIPMSLRQLYYQMVARNWIANRQSEYDRLGGVVSDARLAGLISWTAIEDRNRGLMGLRCWDGPKDAVKSVIDDYRIDKWANQPIRPEVWVEKAALEGVVGTICNKLQVDFFSCRGYNSQSEQWRAGRRFADYYRRGQKPIVFHLGDHDPSGIDMTRDNRDRLSMFAGVEVQVVRLALNMPQIEELKPPPNPTKVSDSRAQGYISKYGNECWELDALSPEYIYRLIEDAVLRVRDQALWDETTAQEAADIRVLEMTHEELR